MSNGDAKRLRWLQELAKLHGVQTSYLDVAKRRVETSAESLAAVLAVLGVETREDLAGQFQSAEAKSWKRALEPIQIAWNGALPELQVKLPAEAFRRPAGFLLQLESGDIQAGSIRWEGSTIQAQATVSNLAYQARSVPCGLDLPAGYHQLTIETRPGLFTSTILAAPEKMFTRPATRAWGLFAPLYGLRNGRTSGAGTYRQLQQLMEWQARKGGSFVGTLPLLPAFLDEPFEPSPYSPVSRLAWNEFYIDLESIPEFWQCLPARQLLGSAPFRKTLRLLETSDVVRYREEMALKRQVLEVLAKFLFRSDSPRRQEAKRFIAANPTLVGYAEFRAAVEKQRAPWGDWPERMRTGQLRRGDYAEETKRYYLYAQWIAHEQMKSIALASKRLGVSLYLDMPLGVHSDGYDAWNEKDLFALGASGGAPPDAVFTKGQDWGFAPIHPQRAREKGYQYMVEYLRHHLRHAGLLRIDHVMGLHRLYWVPKGLPASQGAYVKYPFDELYAVLSIESHRHRSVIVGENLGTVPPAVNTNMKRHRVREMFVFQYELRPDARRPLRPVPQAAVVSLNTHDMPPFAAFWNDDDVVDRRDLGLLNRNAQIAEKKTRARMRQAWGSWLARRNRTRRGPLNVRKALQDTWCFLARSPAEYLLINLEDLWLETASQNVPGTTSERVNWRRRLRYRIDQLDQVPEVAEFLENLKQARQRKK